MSRIGWSVIVHLLLLLDLFRLEAKSRSQLLAGLMANTFTALMFLAPDESLIF